MPHDPASWKQFLATLATPSQPAAMRTAEPRRQPAEIARTLAMGHQIADAMSAGRHNGCALVAKRFEVSPARISQLLTLTLLAPDIQEQIVALEAVNGVQPAISERTLLAIARLVNWPEQWATWSALSEAAALRANAGDSLAAVDGAADRGVASLRRSAIQLSLR